jgi:hypothetical protein
MANQDMKELRGLAPADLVKALDAIAMAKGLDRNAYVNAVLEKHVRSYLDELSVVSSSLKGNPLLTDSSRNGGGNSQFGGLQ